MTRFKVFSGEPAAVERALNQWAAALPLGTRIRRTQLAAGGMGPVVPGQFAVDYGCLYALVNYDDPPRSENGLKGENGG